MREHKTDMNISKTDKDEETEQHFYNEDKTKQVHFGEPSKGVTNLKTPPRKRLTKIYNQQLTSIHYLYL